MNISVLISVYQKEKPDYLRQSLDSIFRQEMPPAEVVLVEDGPLTHELHEVVHLFQEEHPEMKTVVLEKNKGLGPALAAGLPHCSYDIVARMDSDDICWPERFKKESDYLAAHPETDVVGAWVEEFYETPTRIRSTRKLPETHERIRRLSRYRNPMNHPTVMFRKAAAERAGSYRHCPQFEDYDLWMRMLRQGSVFHNLQEPLLSFRLTPQFFSRRGGLGYIRQEINFQRMLHQNGDISLPVMVVNITLRTLLRIVPSGWRRVCYLFFLRK